MPEGYVKEHFLIYTLIAKDKIAKDIISENSQNI